MFHFEKRGQPLLNRQQFIKRLLKSGAFALGLIAVALFAGMLGYYYLVGCKTWTDAFLNASMILGGMGPIEIDLRPGYAKNGQAGEIFQGLYALFSGLVFIGLAGLLFLPVAHRLLHRFHYEDDANS